MRIHERYQVIAKKYSTGRVLKTDVWNETQEHLPIPADKYIEVDKKLVKRARELGYDAIVGDIRFIPYHQEFDTVVDLSTIDHVEDYPLALEEYARVLNDHGSLVLAVWLGNHESEKMSNWGGLQYYFEENEFRDELEKYFHIDYEEALLQSTVITPGKRVPEVDPGGTYLKLFHCVKK